MNILNNLTIIIPTYNRPKDVIRAMKFWSGKGPEVFVLDGSQEKIEFNEKNFHENINYYYMNSSYNDRLKFAVNLEKNKYTLLHADDEFHLPENLVKCIDFLERNKDYGSCIGQCNSFSYSNGVTEFYESYTNLIGHQVDAITENERMEYHFINYVPSSIYGVCCTSNWDKCVNFMTEKQFSAYAIEEYQFEGMMSLLGKMKVLENVTWLRNNINKSHGGTENSNGRSLLFYQWWEKNEWKEEKKEFLDICEKYNLSEFDGRVCFKSGYEHLFRKMKKKYNLKIRLIYFISDFLGRHPRIFKIRDKFRYNRQKEISKLTSPSIREILRLLETE